MPRTDYATKFAKHKNIKRESGGWFLYRPNGYRECLISIPGVWEGIEDEDVEVIDLTAPASPELERVVSPVAGTVVDKPEDTVEEPPAEVVEDITESETVPDALVEEEPVETPEEVVQEDQEGPVEAVVIDYDSMTKGKFAEFALKEYDIIISSNDNKKTMIEKFEIAMDEKG